MNSVNKTLYIPLCGKAFVSRKGIILHDPKAEEIWETEQFPLKGKAKSKWLAYYMGMRSAAFDNWLHNTMDSRKSAVVIHLGCGMDSRCLRVGSWGHQWYDVDFPEVIAERRRYFSESDTYHMVGHDLRSDDWLSSIPGGSDAIVVMEGVSMYLTEGELARLMEMLCGHFTHVSVLMDCYTVLAAKATKYKNPINSVGVHRVYGLDDPRQLETGTFRFVREHDMTPEEKISELSGMEQSIFRRIYAGSFSRKLYRMYEYRK
ncbi:MAG: class I SAM-dependent methyltransferase [Oscillospiraceae bacterium]|nr:class I SAM-dependent methyltransferase [Oscillospiraceae bacterium]